MGVEEFVLHPKNFEAEISLPAQQCVFWCVRWQLLNDFIPPVCERVDTFSQWCPCVGVVVEAVERIDDGSELLGVFPTHV